MSLNTSLSCCDTSVGSIAQFFGLFVQAIVTAKLAASSSHIWPKDYGLNIQNNGLQNYDFIVIGAGSAGSVIANRLSENPKWKVLLLEAGGDPPIQSEIPSQSDALIKTKYDWGYYTDKSKDAGLSTPLGIYWPRGKLLGGSSAINNLVYVRGNNEDYDNWERLGNPGWGWKDVVHYYKKSEDNQNPDFIGPYHASGGPLKVDYFSYTDPFTNIFRIASEKLGYHQVDDLTGNTFVGFTYVQSTVYKGTRWSSAKAFLNPIKNRKNLHIIKQAHVSKININKNNEVESVSFVLNNKTKYKANIAKEVILSAGTTNSPQLLMLSGIGPRQELKKHGIDIIKNLPVGLNLRDHLVVPLFFTFRSTSKEMSTKDLIKNNIQYLLFHSGPISGGVNFVGMIDSTRSNSSVPDIQFHYLSFRKQHGSIEKFSIFDGYADYVKNQIKAYNNIYDIGVVLISLLRPKSVGTIKLNSSKYDDKPKITPNYLTEQSDLETVIHAVEQQIEFTKTKIFKQNEGAVMKIRLPGCDEFEFDSDNYRGCYIRHMVTTIFHPTGTVKMGPENDNDSVVNSKLQVKGVRKLRVADASIMPMIVSGNTNGACMMIGEKASDLIKEDYV